MTGERGLIETVLWVGLLVALVAFLTGCENRMVYHPAKYPEGEWPETGPEDVWFQAKDGVRLHGWYLPAARPRATLLWFHGNAGNVTHRLDNIRRLEPLGLNIFIFDYRGYGRSEGAPGEEGLRLDAQAAYETLVRTREVSPSRLFLFGRSLGGFFAADVARQYPAAGLILESTFTSAKDMARHLFAGLPVGGLVRARLDVADRVRQLTMPKLFLHGTRDTVVPYALGRQLYEAAAEPKEFYDIEGADHNDTYSTGGEAYLQVFDRFIARTLDNPAPDRSPARDR